MTSSLLLVGLKEVVAHSERTQTLGDLVRGSAEESLLLACTAES